MLTTGETMGLAEWIIDDTCLVSRFASLLEVPGVQLKFIHLTENYYKTWTIIPNSVELLWSISFWKMSFWIHFLRGTSVI